MKPEDSTKKKDEQQCNEPEEIVHKQESELEMVIERNKSVPNIPEKIINQESEKERAKSEGPPKVIEKQPVVLNGPVPDSHK